jgi:hypothetical protein
LKVRYGELEFVLTVKYPVRIAWVKKRAKKLVSR